MPERTDLVIRGGRVVDATGERQADVLVRDGVVVEVGEHGSVERPDGARVLDAGGCIVATATRDGRHLVAVVLNATRHSAEDATTLLNYGFSIHPRLPLPPWPEAPAS